MQEWKSSSELFRVERIKATTAVDSFLFGTAHFLNHKNKKIANEYDSTIPIQNINLLFYFLFECLACWVKISADDIFKYFFLIFPRKISFEISCKLSFFPRNKTLRFHANFA